MNCGHNKMDMSVIAKTSEDTPTAAAMCSDAGVKNCDRSPGLVACELKLPPSLLQGGFSLLREDAISKRLDHCIKTYVGKGLYKLIKSILILLAHPWCFGVTVKEVFFVRKDRIVTIKNTYTQRDLKPYVSPRAMPFFISPIGRPGWSDSTSVCTRGDKHGGTWNCISLQMVRAFFFTPDHHGRRIHYHHIRRRIQQTNNTTYADDKLRKL